MIHTRKAADGSLSDTGYREAAYPDDVALDAMPTDFGLLILDPQNPRRAIPDPAEPERRAAKARLEEAIAKETRALVLERLAAKGNVDAIKELEK